jgi:hypothetical protein
MSVKNVNSPYLLTLPRTNIIDLKSFSGVHIYTFGRQIYNFHCTFLLDHMRPHIQYVLCAVLERDI